MQRMRALKLSVSDQFGVVVWHNVLETFDPFGGRAARRPFILPVVKPVAVGRQLLVGDACFGVPVWRPLALRLKVWR
jgi:hypothetical protein